VKSRRLIDRHRVIIVDDSSRGKLHAGLGLLVFRVIHTIHPVMKHLAQYRFTGKSRCPRRKWIPAFEDVIQSRKFWTSLGFVSPL
jgi:hypothetical protein